jgi:hypothetical protein
MVDAADKPGLTAISPIPKPIDGAWFSHQEWRQ